MKFNLLISAYFLFFHLLVSCGNTDHKTVASKPIENAAELDSAKYEILDIEVRPSVRNFYVLLKGIPIQKDSLLTFVNEFRDLYCAVDCNISIYDDTAVKSIMKKYPIEGEEYIKLADHFVAYSEFEIKDVEMYPFQDSVYKKYGGKNWKK